MTHRPFARALLLTAALLATSSLPAGARAASAAAADKATCRPILVSGPGVPVGTASCPGVRPGAIVQTPIGLCTFNFLFRDPKNGARYMGTAGHCILEDAAGNPAGLQLDVGEKTWARGKGPVAQDSAGKRIGEFAYAILKNPKDFALIRLDPKVKASAQMCYFGGPTGMNVATQGPTILHYFGNGVGIGDALPARTAIAPAMSSPDHVYAEGAIAPGDSGSGIISDDGKAVGVIVAVGASWSGVGDAGNMDITRLPPQLARAAKLLKIRLSLVTAPLL